jgi:D-amino-acid dehydrogenase
MRVVVVGGGIIGLACAYELRKRGADVTVLDEREMGMGASWGNAGWIVPSLSGPVPEPGLTLTALRWLLKSDSPLYIKPRLDPGFVRWLWDFWKRCNRRDYEAGIAAMARLNRSTMELYDAWQAEGVDFEMHRAGLVFAFVSEDGLRHHLDGFAYLEPHGYSRPESLSGTEVRRMAPILSANVVGGFIVERERHLEPGALIRGLVERLTIDGVDLRPRTRVTGLLRVTGRTGSSYGRIEAVQTEDRIVEGDAFLLAAGAWSADLAAQAGFQLPVESGKGYSITIERPHVRLERPLYLGEAKVGMSPYDDSIRLAGTMELSGLSENVDQRRIDSIRRSVGRFVTEWPAGEREIAWAGMRPLTPDGLPVLGRAPRLENLFVATGHSMLGITLAPATATAMADLICASKKQVDLEPFDPGRFG